MERPGFIKGVPLDETHGRQVILPITGLVRPSAVDFNSRTGFIVYSDVQRYSYVFRSSLLVKSLATASNALFYAS
jgi:hypothetical protein